MKITRKHSGMEYDAGILEKNYGTVEHNGETLWLIQAPYPFGPADTVGYEYIASAVDADGNDYTVSWDVLPDFDPNDTDDNACDWTKYRVHKH